jgi:S1-C subfamily serine protease
MATDRSRNVLSLTLAILLGATIGFALFWSWLGFPPPANDPNAAPRPVAPKSPTDVEETEAIQLFKSAKDSVVNVDTVALVQKWDFRIEQQQTGTGSGFIWDADGRIVTNFHVIKDAVVNRRSVRIVLADRSTHEAGLVGAAPDFDLAVLQITTRKDKLKPITIGTSSDLQVGQKAYAIGNPFGLSLSMSKGIISALDRDIESPTERLIPGCIQTDAPINPGNSGGPLLDKDGRLIGVNTSIATPSGGNVGIGFAIPVDLVNTIVPELIRAGKLLRPDVGVRLVDQRRVRRAGFANGVMIQDVRPNGPAAKAGLKGLRTEPRSGETIPGDLIVSVKGQPINTPQQFEEAIRQCTVGETITLGLERNGEASEVSVTLGGI